MRFLANLLLFFVLFVPLTCGTGLAIDAFVGPVPPTRIGYAFGLFLSRVLPLILPSVVAVPVLHIAFRILLEDPGSTRTRWIVVATVPAALLALHVAFFGVAYVSAPLLMLFGVAGAVYGAVFRLVPRGREA